MTMLSRFPMQKFIILFASCFIIAGCNKNLKSEEDAILGKWTREGTDGNGPGNTLIFSKKNGTYTLSFDCSGSPGPDWPSHADTEYKFENGKLKYLIYYDTREGFYTVENFKWLVKAESFEVHLREILLFMSADYPVKYNKVD